MASAWRVIAEESNVSTLTVSEKVRVILPELASNMKSRSSGFVMSAVKPAACKASSLKIAFTELPIISSTVAGIRERWVSVVPVPKSQ